MFLETIHFIFFKKMNKKVCTKIAWILIAKLILI